jgi:dephospho-CoA kinase
VSADSGPAHPPAVGLTGGIGSGKSTVAALLRSLGAAIVDTDDISHRLTGPGGAAIGAIRAAFGSGYVTSVGALDRDAMRSLVFADPKARTRLEAILHPAIRRAADAELAQAKGPYALVVIPLLFETRAYLDRLARVLVVDCPEFLQVRRTAARAGLLEDEVRAIMAAQWPRWRRLQMADDVVWNGGEEAALRPQCEWVHRAYCEGALASSTIPANPRAGR